MMAADGGEEVWGHFYPQAVDYACYVHFIMSTTSERDFKTPYEQIKGLIPDISHLRVMFSECFPKFPSTQESRPCVFLGFQTMSSRTYKVLVDDNRTIRHTRHVNFDLDTTVFRQRQESQAEAPTQGPCIDVFPMDVPWPDKRDDSEDRDEDAQQEHFKHLEEHADDSEEARLDEHVEDHQEYFEERVQHEAEHFDEPPAQLRRSQRERRQAHDHDAKD